MVSLEAAIRKKSVSRQLIFDVSNAILPSIWCPLPTHERQKRKRSWEGKESGVRLFLGAYAILCQGKGEGTPLYLLSGRRNPAVNFPFPILMMQDSLLTPGNARLVTATRFLHQLENLMLTPDYLQLVKGTVGSSSLSLPPTVTRRGNTFLSAPVNGNRWSGKEREMSGESKGVTSCYTFGDAHDGLGRRAARSQESGFLVTFMLAGS